MARFVECTEAEVMLEPGRPHRNKTINLANVLELDTTEMRVDGFGKTKPVIVFTFINSEKSKWVLSDTTSATENYQAILNLND